MCIRDRHRMGPRHHQGSAGALVRNVADQKDDKIIANQKMIDEIAANFFGRLKYRAQRNGTPAADSVERRRL